jgi:lipopolysaccharide transport protein LptA
VLMNHRKKLNKVLMCALLLTSSTFYSEVLFADIVDDISELESKPKKLDSATPKEKPLTSPPPLTSPETNTSEKPPRSPEGKQKKDNKPEKNDRRKLPIHLQSEGTSTYSQNGSLVYLEKNVVITQDDVRIQSDEAKVKLGDKNSESNVESVEMKGRVNLNRFSNDPSERITAKGDRAVFHNRNQLVTLEGNARLWRDGHLIRGDKIVYEIETGMVKVDRVQGVVQPDKAKP